MLLLVLWPGQQASAASRERDAQAHRNPHALASLSAQRDCLEDPVRFLIADREFHFAI